MSTGLLFITAQTADLPFVNRLLLYLRDWDVGTDPTWDNFRIVTSKSKVDLLDEQQHEPTAPPIQSFVDNEWAGESIANVESFMLEAQKSKEELDGGGANVNLRLFLIVDDEGLQNENLVILEQVIEDEPFRYLDRFNKLRLPWEDTQITWVNLDIANMGFEDFCNQDKGADGEDWWEYRKIEADKSDAGRVKWEKERNEDLRRQRTKAIKALRELGLA